MRVAPCVRNAQLAGVVKYVRRGMSLQSQLVKLWKRPRGLNTEREARHASLAGDQRHAAGLRQRGQAATEGA